MVGLVRGIERGEKMLDEIAAEIGGRDGPILDYARLRAQISERENGAVARVAAAAQAGRQRCAVVVAARRHHQPSSTGGAAGLAVVLEPARDERRPAAAGADRKPLGGPDFVGRLLGRVGEAWGR